VEPVALGAKPQKAGDILSLMDSVNNADRVSKPPRLGVGVYKDTLAPSAGCISLPHYTHCAGDLTS
jgi:hypothetical protein